MDTDAWLESHPKLRAILPEALRQIERIVGAGKPVRLNVIEDWEGTKILGIEVDFEGSGEEASSLCRRFIYGWLVHQPRRIRKAIDCGVRFL